MSLKVIETPGEFIIEFPFDQVKVDAVRKLPGRAYQPLTKTWTVPARHKTEVQKFIDQFSGHHKFQEAAAQANYVIPPLPELTAEQEAYLATRLKPFNSKGEPQSLRHYQKSGVAYNAKHKRTIIGDTMRLGKSIQSISSVILLDRFPCLCISPNTLKFQWEKEWRDWTYHKPLILDEKNYRYLNRFIETGLADVIIVNYESLKKYFVKEIKKPKGEKFRITDVVWQPIKDIFKSVIIDEFHKCLPYETKVLTDLGLIEIGTIVERKLNVSVASIRDGEMTFQKVVNHWKNKINGKKIVLIKHSAGQLCATEDHKIYTDAGRFKEAGSLSRGEGVYLLRKEFLDEKSWQEHGAVLQQKLCKPLDQYIAKSEELSSQGEEAETTSIEALSVLREGIYTNSCNPRDINTKILQSEVFSKMEVESSRISEQENQRGDESENEQIRKRANEGSCIKEDAFGADESEQPFTKPNYQSEDDRIQQGSNILVQGRQWPINNTANNTLQSIESSGELYGACNSNGTSEESVSITAISLQSGYSNTLNQSGNRGGRPYSQAEEVEILRPEENRSIECVRVESVEVLESGNLDESASGTTNHPYVYDIEVENNHNYFAEGILVSNCKAFGTLQTRFVRGIAAEKEVVFGLSGTPVVNNPMDLVPQLGILDQLDKVGGYKYYIDRYVGGQPSRFKKPKPRNLSELNFNLNQHCYYRRDMNDVFKDMPPKSRQIVECEITTREEYNKAENDLENYLETVKGYSIDQIDKSMRGKIMVQIGILKNISARGKMETVQDFIQETIDSGEKIIVFGNLTVVLDEVCRLFPSAVSVVGKDSMEQRNSNIQKFQNHPDCNIMVCNFRTGGVGIDLAASNIVSFIELDWTPAAHDQAESRAIKAGKTSAISCPYFIGKNTIDEHIYEIINNKRDIVSQITGVIDPTEEEKVSSGNLAEFISLFNNKRGV